MSRGTFKTCREALVLALVLAAPPAFATDPAPVYRLDAEVAVRGVVEHVVQHAGWMGWDGVYATLRTNQGEILQTHLAPAAFLKMLELLPAPGDPLELKGAFAESPSGRILLVRELRRANVVIHLRDARGAPVW